MNWYGFILGKQQRTLEEHITDLLLFQILKIISTGSKIRNFINYLNLS